MNRYSKRLQLVLLVALVLAAQTQCPGQAVAAAPAQPGGASSETGTTSPNPNNTANYRPIPGPTSGVPPTTDYNLELQWNESMRGATLSYPNNGTSSLSIQGIQATGNIFVVSYPSTIAAGAAGNIEVVYLAQAGTQADSDVLRLLTSDGIKLLRVAHGRPSVVSMDQPRLVWQVGDALAPKTVTITLTNGVQVAGVNGFDGCQATFSKVKAGVFAVSVTPASTSAPDHFPVFVILSPSVPNTAPTIDCVVGTLN